MTQPIIHFHLGTLSQSPSPNLEAFWKCFLGIYSSKTQGPLYFSLYCRCLAQCSNWFWNEKMPDSSLWVLWKHAVGSHLWRSLKESGDRFNSHCTILQKTDTTFYYLPQICQRKKWKTLFTIIARTSSKQYSGSIPSLCYWGRLRELLLRKATWVLVEDGDETQDGPTHAQVAVHRPLNSEHTSEGHLRKQLAFVWWYMEYSPKIF